jgi:hypothetical protein
MIRTLAPLAMLLMIGSVGLAEDAPKKQPFIIGDARMTEDGTIVVNLRRTADGINVSGIVKYTVDDPHYTAVLNHLGGMKPGDTRLVPAWDDAAPDKK